MLRLVLVLILATGAGGCSSDHVDLRAYFQDVEARGETRHGIVPLPDIPPLAAPDTGLSRDPFSYGN